MQNGRDKVQGGADTKDEHWAIPLLVTLGLSNLAVVHAALTYLS